MGRCLVVNKGCELSDPVMVDVSDSGHIIVRQGNDTVVIFQKDVDVIVRFLVEQCLGIQDRWLDSAKRISESEQEPGENPAVDIARELLRAKPIAQGYVCPQCGEGVWDDQLPHKCEV